MAQINVTVDQWVSCDCGFFIAVRSEIGVLLDGRHESFVEHAQRCPWFHNRLEVTDGVGVEVVPT